MCLPEDEDKQKVPQQGIASHRETAQLCYCYLCIPLFISELGPLSSHPNHSPGASSQLKERTKLTGLRNNPVAFVCWLVGWSVFESQRKERFLGTYELPLQDGLSALPSNTMAKLDNDLRVFHSIPHPIPHPCTCRDKKKKIMSDKSWCQAHNG